MNGNVESKQLNKRLVVSETKECRKIPGIVLVSVDSREFALAVDIAIDTTSNVREFGNPTTSSTSRNVSVTLLTHRSIQSSNTGPQYSFFGVPSWYALAKVESWLSYIDINHPMAHIKDERAYSSDGKRKLAHWVESRRASVKQFLNEFGNRGTSSPVLGESGDLLLCGDLASNEEPKESFGQGFRATRSFWE